MSGFVSALTVLTLLAHALQNAAPPAKPQTGRVSGRVTDALTGQPIPGALVFSNPMPQRGESGGQTDADGRYLLEGLQPRKYIIRAEHPAYATGIIGSVPRGDAREPIEVVAGQHRIEVNLSLTRAGRITGQITTEAGQPVAGVNVSAAGGVVAYFDAHQTVSVNSAVTNEKGEYDIRVWSLRTILIDGREASPPEVLINGAQTIEQIQIVISRQ